MKIFLGERGSALKITVITAHTCTCCPMGLLSTFSYVEMADLFEFMVEYSNFISAKYATKSSAYVTRHL